MKTAVLASLIASAAAFAPASPKASTATAVSATMDGMPGSIDFMGKPFKFDPLGLSETYSPWVPYFRESELRHGRTAMLAVTGWIVQDFIRLPGDMYSFDSIPTSKDAHDALLAPPGPMGQLLFFIGLWDVVVTGPAISAMMAGEREPGDYGWTNFAPKDPTKYNAMVDKELLNGRLAMMAIGGIATQSVLTGHSFPYI